MLANSMSWVTTMAVSQTPSRSEAISSATSLALVGSSPAVGSSKKTTSGSSTRARAMPTRLRMPPERQHRFFAHAFDVGPEERHLPGVRPDQPVRDAQEHGLARAAPAHDGQRGALAEGQAHALEDRLVPEGLPHLSELDGNLGSRRHGIHRRKRMKKSLVRKKSEM